MRQWSAISLCLNKRRRVLPALAAVLAILVCTPAMADDPFQMESSSWMSFDRYKEKPANWIAPDERSQAAAQPVVVPPPLTPADMPVITPPTRELSVPAMPGVNNDFEVKVDTTEDQHWRPAPVIKHMDTDPEMDVQNEWKDAAEAARANRDKNQTLESEDGKPAYDVRLSYLPARITPLPKPKQLAKKAPELLQTKAPETKTAEAPKPKAPEKPKVDQAACAAIEAYKQHQLQAIESDRQTLKALQDAISQLGLSKQLDFMNGATGSLSIEAGAASQQPKTP